MSEWNAYVAGFFDGEGSVSIARVRIGDQSDYHKIVVNIGQRAKYRDILDRICDSFGGAVRIANQKTRVAERWAVHANWQLQDKASIGPFLLAMQPYCIVKARQIEIGLEFIQSFHKSPNVRDGLGRLRGRVLSADEIERRERLRLALRDANELGPPRAKPSILPPLDVQWRRESELVANPATVSRGEQRWNARFTEDEIREIRSDYESGTFTQEELAEQFEVSLMTINKIVNLKTWKHVT